jgi:hypothetical protein
MPVSIVYQTNLDINCAYSFIQVPIEMNDKIHPQATEFVNGKHCKATLIPYKHRLIISKYAARIQRGLC